MNNIIIERKSQNDSKFNISHNQHDLNNQMSLSLT